MTADDFIEAGDQVVVFMRTSCAGSDDGGVFEQPTTAVWTLRDGKAVRVRYYENNADALEAVGLSE